MSGWIPTNGAFKLAVVLLLAAVAAATFSTGVILSDISHNLNDRRYLDCVVISGDEMICKQVNATEPGYVPAPGHGTDTPISQK